MASRRRNRQNNPFVQRTGDDFAQPDDAIASDSGVESSSTEGQQFGRTPYDLMHESGLHRTLSKVFDTMDVFEVLIVAAYVILSGWGHAPHPVMPFWLFIAIILAYHVVGRPLISFLAKKAARETPRVPRA